ncbi:permease of an ABC exporter involved in polysaccharide export [Bordetella ansorpii]|uniref:Transport permease protein n=1 Tax=Bordetella ansorpii TaxID=288768 RepID=A0A157SXP9_9BORD|nr:ABC transporter permease [Bordetella ansorpii]SAI74823.1 permease of an ABC exporter involved in polysaccharide export [Bordetella ansorpii]
MGMKKRQPLAITRAVIFALVLREVRGRFGARRAGAFWFFFEPIAHVVGVMAIMTLLRGRQVPGLDFPVYLITGIVPFLMFKNIMLKSMEAINANKALFAYKQIKPFDTVVARTLVEFTLMACVYVLIMSGLGFWAGYDVSMTDPLRWMAIMVLGVSFSFGIGLILCVVVDALPELRVFLRLIFMPLYFLSGVIFPVWLVPPQILQYLLWNPLLHIIDELRIGVFDHYHHTAGITIVYPLALTIVVLFIGTALYRARRLHLVAA